MSAKSIERVARSDISGFEWEIIKAVLPNKTQGKKRVADRRVLNGIFYVLRTGIPWADLLAGKVYDADWIRD